MTYVRSSRIPKKAAKKKAAKKKAVKKTAKKAAPKKAAKKGSKKLKEKKKRIPCSEPKVPIRDLVGKSWETLYREAVVSSEVRSDRSGVFHPSAVGMCGRASVYCYINAPSKMAFKAKDLNIFWLGHQLHARVQDMMDVVARTLSRGEGSATFDAEVPTPPCDELLEAVGVGGTTDGLFVYTFEGSTRYMIEIKSINKDGFVKVVDSGRPMESHEMQTHLYAHRFDCDQLVYFYVCKDNCEIHVIEQSFNRGIFNVAVSKYERLFAHVEAGTLPDREEDWFSCSRCEYQEICKPTVLEKRRHGQKKDKMAKARKRGFRR